MKITITKQDAEKAKEYTSNTDCLLATALKRILPKAKIKVYPCNFVVNGKWYVLSNDVIDKIYHSYQTIKNWKTRIDLDRFQEINFVAKAE